MKTFLKLVISVVAVSLSYPCFGCYRDGLYVCRQGSAGTNVWCMYDCDPPPSNLSCYEVETTGYVTRAANGANSGSVSICNGTMNCTYTVLKWDCFGVAADPVTHNIPMEGSYSCGGPCDP
jgi:hypothetical protein